MAFNTANYLGNVCPYYEPDDTQYGTGTTRPAGFLLKDLMPIYWQWNNLAIYGAGESSAEIDCNGCDITDFPPCTCTSIGAANAGNYLPNPRPNDTMSKILCNGSYLTAHNDGGVLGIGAGDGSTSLVIIDFTQPVACDTDINTQADWSTAMFYPLISVTVSVLDDGSSDCMAGGLGGSIACMGMVFSTVGDPSTTPSGNANFVDDSGEGSVAVIDLYPDQGLQNAACEVYHPENCNGGGDFGTRKCGPTDGTDCLFCGTNPCPEDGSIAPPDCDAANCASECVPACCPAPGCDDSCVASGCGFGDEFSQPCTFDFALCGVGSVFGEVFANIFHDLTIDES